MSERESESSINIGCTSPLGVLIFGLGLTLFGSALGTGCSVRIPLSESNISVAGSVGKKEKVTEALPNYLRDRLASNYDFINSSATLTIGPAEGTGVFVMGEQPGAPWVDLNVTLSRP